MVHSAHESGAMSVSGAGDWGALSVSRGESLSDYVFCRCFPGTMAERMLALGANTSGRRSDGAHQVMARTRDQGDEFAFVVLGLRF